MKRLYRQTFRLVDSPSPDRMKTLATLAWLTPDEYANVIDHCHTLDGHRNRQEYLEEVTRCVKEQNAARGMR